MRLRLRATSSNHHIIFEFDFDEKNFGEKNFFGNLIDLDDNFDDLNLKKTGLKTYLKNERNFHIEELKT